MNGSKMKELEQLHKDRSVWHVVKEGETLFSIAHDYGMPHWQNIWNHERNKELRKRREKPSPGNMQLLTGDVVFIPRLNPFKTGNREPAKHHRFKIEPYRAMHAIPKETAKILARRCAREAYDAVEKGHVGSLDRLLRASAHGAYHYKFRRRLAKGFVVLAGAGVSITVGVLTGGIAVGAALGIAGGVWAVNKLVDGAFTMGNNSKLRQYWNNKEMYTTLEDRLAHREGRKELLRDKMTEDAKDCIRKAVVHLRRARKLHDTKLKKYFIDFSDEDNLEDLNCERFILHTKASMKFMHHLNKVRNYLLPCISFGAFFMDVYEEVAGNWDKAREKVEGKIVEYMEKGTHENCKNEGKDKLCYRGALNRSQIFAADLMLGADARATDRAAGMHRGYTGKGKYSQVSIRSIKLDDVRNMLIDFAEVYKDSVGRYKKYAAIAGKTGRYKIFLDDVMKRYEAPGLLTRIRHKYRNKYRSTTAGEKFSALLEDGLSIGVGAVGGYYLSEAVGETVKAGGKAVADQVVKIAKGAAKVGLSSTAHMTEGITVWAVFRYGAKSDMMESDLLHFQGERITRAAVRIFSEEGKGAKKKAEKELKEGAVVVEKLFEKVAYHFKKANTAAENIQGLKVDIGTCEQCLEFAKLLYELHHEMDKMERYLMAALSLVVEIAAWVNILTDREKEILESLEPGQPVEKWVNMSPKDDWAQEKEGGHWNCYWNNCHCYGPKLEPYFDYLDYIMRDPVFDETKPHKPL